MEDWHRVSPVNMLDIYLMWVLRLGVTQVSVIIAVFLEKDNLFHQSTFTLACSFSALAIFPCSTVIQRLSSTTLQSSVSVAQLFFLELFFANY